MIKWDREREKPSLYGWAGAEEVFDTLSGHCIASSGAILNFFFLFFSRAAVGGEGGGKGGSCLKRE